MDISKQHIAISSDIATTLAKYAQTMNMNLNQVVDQILSSFIHSSGLAASPHDEKRKFRRKNVVIPAVAYEKSLHSNAGRYFATTLLDISIGGTKLFFPLEMQDKIEFLKTQNNFDVIFCFFGTNNISRFTCRPVHTKKNKVNIKVGGAFVQSDAYSFEQLNKYFTESDA